MFIQRTFPLIHTELCAHFLSISHRGVLSPSESWCIINWESIVVQTDILTHPYKSQIPHCYCLVVFNRLPFP